MTVIINDMKWEIKEAGANDSMLLVEGKRCNGTAHYLHKEIYLDERLNGPHKYQVLCHELTHAFLCETQIDGRDSFDEEMLCEFVGIYAKKITNIADEYFM